jgi:predicted unusual protein kinase regulating ubiquinone biosynthesis (AarF/ABC1/UbiB family)
MDDPYVKIPKVYPQFCGEQLLVMEWIDGVRCTDPEGIVAAGIDRAEFIRVRRRLCHANHPVQTHVAF